jgi:hypothetical protein
LLLWSLGTETNQFFLFVGSATLCFLQAAGREGSCSRLAVSWKGTLIILDLNCQIFDSFYFSDYVVNTLWLSVIIAAVCASKQFRNLQ